jgi:hypothetical protein
VEFLENKILTKERVITSVVGPSGVGKTLTMWNLVLQYAAVKFPEEILWIPVDEFARGKGYLKLFEGKITRVMENEIPIRQETTIVVFDGIDKRNSTTSCALIKRYLDSLLREEYPFSAEVFVVTSIEALLDEIPNVVEHRLDPWSIHDYYEAIADDMFFNSVKKNFEIDSTWMDSIDNRRALIDEKFLVAGSCARWMFDKSTEIVRREINKLVEQIKSYSNWNDISEKSPDAMNQLVVSIGDVRSLTSDYVLRRLFSKTGTDLMTEFLRSAYRARHGINPSLDDWILKLDFLLHVKRSIHASTEEPRLFIVKEDDSLAADPLFIVKDCQMFHSTKVFGLTVETLMSGDNTWYFPEIFNQGGFDIVQILKILDVYTARFFQVTCSSKHDMKLEYMVAFLTKINLLRQAQGHFAISDFEVISVIPFDSEHYEVGRESGSTKRMKYSYRVAKFCQMFP